MPIDATLDGVDLAGDDDVACVFGPVLRAGSTDD